MERGMWKKLTSSYDEALAGLPQALAAQGFGVISEVDLGATLRAKIQAEVGRYKIFGACNPRLAHQAITADRSVGLLLPCNVVLHETADGAVMLGAIDPMASVGADPAFESLAGSVREKLQAVLDAMR